jgi:aldehyde:ferredoxin oxidoreductase
MPNGYWGRILRVDLSNGSIKVEEQDEKFYRQYLGGWGFVVHYLLREVPVGCDPLGPENVLVFAPSILTGTAIPGAARNSAGAKSPLTGAVGVSEAGGDWGVKLRWAGYDAIVITGQSKKPIYLWINDETAELRDASHFWGLEAYETQRAIRDEVGDSQASTALIGPGAERLVRFACIALDLHDFMGRTGLGAVMGAKKLKAVAVNGKTRPEVADRAAVMDTARWMRDNYEVSLGTMQEMGTARGVPVLNSAGGLPTRNFREGSFEGYETISGRYMTDTILVGRESCYACPVHCKRVVEVDEDGLVVSKEYGGPEYETIGGFGSGCGIDDIKVVAKANEICDRHTLDTISAGMMVSGAMECAEKGLLPADLIEGLDLRFGSAQGLLGLLEQIVNREGLGDILAEGPKGVEEKLGQEVASHFLHVKGQPLPLHEPRWKTGMGLGYALSPTGADHMHNIHDPFYASEESPAFDAVRNMGILDAVDTFELSPAKARLYVYMMLNKSVNNSLSLCSFMPYSLDMMVDQVKAVTGWNLSSWELIKAAERALNMARAFNAREGFTASDDSLPGRLFAPLEGGPLKGKKLDHDQFLKTRAITYDMLGWDRQTAAPKRWKLYELGLDWVVEDLVNHGVLESEGKY